MVLSRGVIKTGFVFTSYLWLLHGEWKIRALGRAQSPPPAQVVSIQQRRQYTNRTALPRGRAACGGRYKAVWEHNTGDSFSLGGFVEKGDA